MLPDNELDHLLNYLDSLSILKDHYVIKVLYLRYCTVFSPRHSPDVLVSIRSMYQSNKPLRRGNLNLGSSG
jgi:hypothetical protein